MTKENQEDKNIPGWQKALWAIIISVIVFFIIVWFIKPTFLAKQQATPITENQTTTPTTSTETTVDSKTTASASKSSSNTAPVAKSSTTTPKSAPAPQVKWITEHQKSFTPGKGHRMYKVKYIGGKRTNVTEYFVPDRYILIGSETISTPTTPTTTNPAPTPVVAARPQGTYIGLSGVPIDYVDTGKTGGMNLNLTVPAGYVFIGSGYSIQINGQQLPAGSFWAASAGTTLTGYIFDGFRLFVPTTHAQAEWNARIDLAKQKGWTVGEQYPNSVVQAH